ncbi:MAG: hypothetical protein CMH54_02325 [Myxococcales bacterium]|nr:hypothetical protein [Myxococcales bacterium]
MKGSPVSNRTLWLPVACALGAVSLLWLFLPGLGPTVRDSSLGPFGLLGPGLVMVVGGALTIFAALQSRYGNLAAPGLLLLSYGLGVFEMQTGCSPWHRSVPQPFGVGPDLLLVSTAGLLFAGKKRAARFCLVGASILLFAPVAVVEATSSTPAIRYKPGLFGFTDDPFSAPDSATFWNLISACHIAILLLLAYGAWSWRGVSSRMLLGSMLVWAVCSSAFGQGGWAEAIGVWSSLGHIVVRVGVLGLLAVGVWTLTSERESAISTEVVLAGLVLLVFALLKWQGLHWSATDENVYFYAAAKVQDGILPYRDYFFAHPPLRVFLPGTIFAIFGFSVWTAQLIPIVAAMASGILLWRIVRHQSNGLTGVLAMALFLGATQTLLASTDMTGINMTTALVLGAVLGAVKGRYVLAGVLLGMATGVGMIAVWWFPALLIYCVRVGGWSACGRFAAGFFALELLVHGGGLLLGGEAYMDGVFRFHGLKAPANPGYENFGMNPFKALLFLPGNLEVLLTSTGFKKVMYYHGMELGLLVGVAIPWLALTWRRQRKTTKQTAVTNQGVELWFLAFCAGLAFMASIREQYDFYWVVFLPVVAALLALAGRSITHHFAHQTPRRVLGMVLTALLLCAFMPSNTATTRFASEVKDAGKVIHLDWRSSAPATGIDGFTASLFFKPERVVGELETSVFRYLWSKKRSFSSVDQFARVIRERRANGTLPKDATLTGAQGIAPLIALRAGIRMSGNEVDTNAKVFKTGIRASARFWSKACKDNLEIFVGGEKGYLGSRYLRNSVRGETLRRMLKRDIVAIEEPGSWVRSANLGWRTRTNRMYFLREGADVCRLGRWYISETTGPAQSTIRKTLAPRLR